MKNGRQTPDNATISVHSVPKCRDKKFCHELQETKAFGIYFGYNKSE
jgi:hypothetical protein